MTTTANENNTRKMPITNRNFHTQDITRFRNYRTPAWIKDIDFDKDEKDRTEKKQEEYTTLTSYQLKK